MEEVYVDAPARERTVVAAAPADRELEAEMLTPAMVRLGADRKQAKPRADGRLARRRAAAAARSTPRSRRRRRSGPLEVNEPFDRAWRRVGLALDRVGFTVEDRDRSKGLFFVRYIDPASAGREEPGFLSRLFGGGKKDDVARSLVRYRVVGEG